MKSLFNRSALLFLLALVSGGITSPAANPQTAAVPPHIAIYQHQ